MTFKDREGGISYASFFIAYSSGDFLLKLGAPQQRPKGTKRETKVDSKRAKILATSPEDRPHRKIHTE